ncbi:hypothetical protein B0T24DRAFT_367243 [Lasiosphaeria ovina]|uniref:Vegetative incompatibility protein HET-E-1 n=1 Tax=Lasiosphaeria ovina TaxID=92902 RepID=A0AAE0JYK4_9PEZI|nr:hypothetical protein B0T24DRAFT_367243 [Lasiosphaeria ovina]
MRLINVKTYKLEEFLDYKTPKYAILSHTWGDDGEELTFRDVEEGGIRKPGVGSAKFLGSCRQAVQDRLGYVWIDTCCIDKTNLVELSEAINSMFRWYQRASVCYAYLSDVPSDDEPRKPSSKFCTSRWFGRGWTLQELLAPEQLRFYNSEWGYLGNKGTLRTIVGKITGIPHQILLGISELRSASVAQRMSWAGGRETKRKEDLAYCLLGIFGVTMPMIYGEGGDQAFLRLQDQILRTTRDDSILAWGLISPEKPLINSADQAGQATAGRILATAPSDFAHSGDIVCREQLSTSLNPLDISGGSLRLYLSLLTTSAGSVFGLLNCGPRHDPKRIVGIPLAQMASGASNEYVRPEGCHAALQPITASGASPRLIHIRNDNPSKKSTNARQQYWLYDDDAFAEVSLDLVDVSPSSCWDRDRAMIVSTLVPSGVATHQTLARFRHNDEESPDFVILLEVKQQDNSVKPECHVMICYRNTSLQELADKLQYVLQRASGRDSASNGLLHLRVALESDTQQPVFTIKPEVLSHPPDININIAAELRKSDLMLELVGIWEAKGQNNMEREELEQKVKDKGGRLERAKKERELVEDELRKLEKRRRMLAEEESNESEEMRLLGKKQAAVEARQEQAFQRWSHVRRRWDELYHINHDNHDYDLGEMDDWMPIYWAADRGYAEIVELLLTKGADLDVVNRDGWTPLIAASDKGHIDVVRLLVEKGIDVNAKDKGARTALWYAREARHNAVVQLLHRSGATISNDNVVLTSGSADTTISTAQLQRTLEGHSGSVYSVAFAPNSTVLASGSYDHTIRLWDASTGQLQRTLEGHSSAVSSVAFASNSTMLASGSYDNTIRLWDASTGQLQRTLEGHRSAVYSVAFASNSTVLASGSFDNTIRLWDASTGQLQRTLEGHSGSVYSVAFAPNSTVLASGSYDHTIRLWDASTGQLQRTLEGHSSAVSSVAFASNSTMLASGSYDKTIRLWESIEALST